MKTSVGVTNGILIVCSNCCRQHLCVPSAYCPTPLISTWPLNACLHQTLVSLWWILLTELKVALCTLQLPASGLTSSPLPFISTNPYSCPISHRSYLPKFQHVCCVNFKRVTIIFPSYHTTEDLFSVLIDYSSHNQVNGHCWEISPECSLDFLIFWACAERTQARKCFRNKTSLSLDFYTSWRLLLTSLMAYSPPVWVYSKPTKDGKL